MKTVKTDAVESNVIRIVVGDNAKGKAVITGNTPEPVTRKVAPKRKPVEPKMEPAQIAKELLGILSGKKVPVAKGTLVDGSITVIPVKVVPAAKPAPKPVAAKPAVKKPEAKKPAEKKPAAVLVFGRFRPDSIGGKMATLLSDGVARTAKEIADVVKPRSVENIDSTGGWFTWLKKFGEESGLFDMSKKDGKIQMTVIVETKPEPVKEPEPVVEPAAEKKPAAKKARKAKQAAAEVPAQA